MNKYFYPAIAGIEMHIMRVYAPFLKQNWNVKVFTSRDIFEEKNVLPEFCEEQGMKIYRSNQFTFGVLAFFLAPKNSILSIHNSNIIPHAFILLLLSIRKAFGNKKFNVVLIPHGGFNPDWINFSGFNRKVKSIIHYKILNKIINYVCDGVIAISEWEKQELIKKGIASKIIMVIKNGIEHEAFDIDESRVSKKIIQFRADLGDYIIQVARVNRIKNIETVIKALKYSHDKTIKFLIIGPVQDKKYKEELEEQIKALSLNERVIFAGSISGRDKFYLIRHAKAMVHMAVWESFCNSIYEGMSQGKVIIASNNTAIPYLVKPNETGYLVNTYDHISLAKRLNYILSDKNKKERMKIEAHNKFITQEDTWEVTSKKTQDYYKRLLI